MFHPRVINNTDIPFSDNEMRLLQKGLKYNTHAKNKDWIQTLALEAETAITKLPTNERDIYRKMVANRIDTLHRQNPEHETHPEAKTVNRIRKKLRDNDTMVTRADKGNSIVILPTTQYESKLQDFIDKNDFQTNTQDPTTLFQTQIRSTIRNSPTLIPKEHRWKYINMNPSAPSIKGLIKIHKPDQPICPVVNWRNAPAYKLSRLFTDKIGYLAPNPDAFNIRNTQELLQDLKNTPILPQHKLASLDITNTDSNIPVKETRTILDNTLTQNLIDPHTKQELLEWYDVITKQSYFSHKDTTLIQSDKLAMGAPSSGLIAEIFLQHIEHTHLALLSQKHKIVNYCRYVDDILLIYDSDHTDIQKILTDFNSLHHKLQFTAETEKDHTLNYLDISLHKTPTNIKTAIYRKPTFTDMIIPFNSNHPTQHKYAAIRHLYNRLSSYNLQHNEHAQELNTIHNILHNNSFPIFQHKPPTQNTKTQDTSRPTHIWANFTYIGKETSYITNIFRHTELKMAFRTSNTLGNLLTKKHQYHDTYSRSGVYKLNCPKCNKAYVGQTGRQFSTRYKEHMADFRHNNDRSSFAKHLNEEAHQFGPMEEIMQIIQYQGKEAHLNTIERYHIHTEFAAGNHLNYPQTRSPNAVFQTLTKYQQPR